MPLRIKQHFLLSSVVLFSVLYFFMPRSGCEGDLLFWIQWTRCNIENGLGGVYHCNTNYLPVYHYILYGFGKLCGGNIETVIEHIHRLKAITLVFHFTTGYAILNLLWYAGVRGWKVLGGSLLFTANIAILYNSVIWGQVDGIMTCFIFLAFYLALKKNVVPSLLFMLLAINFKLQAIIFLPLIGLMLLPTLKTQWSMRSLAMWLGIPFILQTLILLPFLMAGTAGQVWVVVMESVGKNPVISMNAYNIWDLLVQGDLMHTPDSTQAMGISYNSLGLLMFFGLSFIALFPLLRFAWSEIRGNASHIPFPLDNLLAIAALIPLIFFFVNTQMHERYAHPALVFLIMHAVISKKPYWAIVGCSAYLLNMEGVLKFFDSGLSESFIFNRGFIAALFLITILGLFWELFNPFRNKSDRSGTNEIVA